MLHGDNLLLDYGTPGTSNIGTLPAYALGSVPVANVTWGIQQALQEVAKLT